MPAGRRAHVMVEVTEVFTTSVISCQREKTAAEGFRGNWRRLVGPEAFGSNRRNEMPSPPGTDAPRTCGETIKQTKSRRSLSMARRPANPIWFALSSAPGSSAVVPSDRPRALGRARSRASPGIRVSRSGRAGNPGLRAGAGEQKTLRSVGSGGSVTTDHLNSRSGEFPPARARASLRRQAVAVQ